MIDEDKIYTHSSYGMISFAKYTGGHFNMFGSELNHNGGICLEIKTAEKHRRLHRDWYMPRDQIIRVHMSYSQFAESIANMNTSGVPCTLMRVRGEKIEECPKQTNEISEIHNEFEEQASKIATMLDKCIKMTREQLNGSKPPTKKEREELLSELTQARMNIQSNMPFIIESFNENVHTIVDSAKAEVEGFVTQKITQYGIEGIRKEMLSLDAAHESD
jgi:hypothetical protein